MTIEEFFRLLLRNAGLIIVMTVLGLAGGYAYSYTMPTVYEAKALGYVTARVETDENGEQIPMGGNVPAAGGDAEKYGTAQTFLPLFNTPAVAKTIIEDLGLEGANPNAIASSLSADINPNVPIITVTARASSPQRAQEIANASISAVNAEGAFLLTGNRDSKDAPMTLISYETAAVPTAPVAPNRLKFGAAGGAAGLLMALGLSWLRNRNDSRVRTVDDIRTKTPVTAIGVLPDSRDLTRTKDGVLPEPKEFHSKEALRKLRTNLRFANVDNPPRSIVISSSAPGEGKSTVSGNLARVIARSGQRVVLIDADLRRPVMAKAFGVDGSVGLSQLIAGAADLEDVVQPTSSKRLFVIPAGQIPPNPSELLGSQRMKDIVEQLAEDFFVIIDAPPILAVTDAVLLSRHADGALIVAVPGRTRVEGLTRAIENVRTVGGNVLGVVMNRASGNLITRLAYGDAEYGYSAYGYSSTTYTYTEDSKGKTRRKRNRNNDLEAPEHGFGENAEIIPAVDGAGSPEPGQPAVEPRRAAPAAAAVAAQSAPTASPAPAAQPAAAAPSAPAAAHAAPPAPAAQSVPTAQPAPTAQSAPTAPPAPTAQSAPSAPPAPTVQSAPSAPPAPTAQPAPAVRSVRTGEAAPRSASAGSSTAAQPESARTASGGQSQAAARLSIQRRARANAEAAQEPTRTITPARGASPAPAPEQEAPSAPTQPPSGTARGTGTETVTTGSVRPSAADQGEARPVRRTRNMPREQG